MDPDGEGIRWGQPANGAFPQLYMCAQTFAFIADTGPWSPGDNNKGVMYLPTLLLTCAPSLMHRGGFWLGVGGVG